jgi:signal transduction histidine kinase
MQAGARIEQLTRTLSQRGKESAASKKRLKQATAQCQAAEAVLKQSANRHAKLLAEAEDLQKYLRHQTREILLAQEDERDRNACELRNEIAQALVAIDLGLLMVGTSAKDHTEKLEKKIANAEELVKLFKRKGYVHGDRKDCS